MQTYPVPHLPEEDAPATRLPYMASEMGGWGGLSSLKLDAQARA
jgi:hypothetical protein